jgi:hypothetical protein
MDLCVENLRQAKSVPQSLMVLTRIITTYPDKRVKKGDTTSSVIDWLNESHSLVDVLFEEIIGYKMKTKAAGIRKVL